MKKIISVFALILMVCLLLAGCGSNNVVNPQNENSSIGETDNSKPDNYPTNKEISYGFLDYRLFDTFLTDGTYRCGSDFEPGDYYIFSLFGAEALYDVSDNPNDFQWTNHRVMRKVSVDKGQYVSLSYGAILVSADDVDTDNWKKYGVFLVGTDLPEGDYKITQIEEMYTDLNQNSGVFGAYQICNNSPENEPEYCSPLFDKQTYVSVKDGQYVIINDAHMVLDGAEETETLNTSKVEPDESKETNITETTYNEAISLTKSSLTGSKGDWSYKGIKLLSDDCEWIDSPINKNGTVNQGAVYRKMAKVLWGSDWENKRFLYKYSSISELLFGFIPETVDDYIPLGKNASEFIVEKEQIKAIMRKFEEVDSVQGNFDFEYGQLGKYDIEILDVKSCAEEMQISEEMLGYVIAMLAEYTPDITFDGNSCHIKYESLQKQITPLEKADFTVTFPSEKMTVDIIEQLNSEYGEESFHYSFYDASVDSSKEGIIETKRGIHIGDSKNAVFASYGEVNENTFMVKNHYTYQIILESDESLAAIMRTQCVSYVSYECKDVGSIDFYFDENACVSWIIFYNY